MVRVAVYNASGVSGAARRLADRLKEAGFSARSVGNAESVDTTQVYFHKAAVKERAQRIRDLAGGGQLVKTTEEDTLKRRLGSPSDDVIIVVGPDLASQIVARN
jgi:hypothetical protein